MSLSERSRSVLFQELSSVVGDEDAVGEMMSFFPARDVEEPVTKEHLRAELVVFRSEVQGEFAAVRADVQHEFAQVRSEMAGEFAAVRSEMGSGFAAVRSEMASEFAAARSDLHREVISSTKWTVGILLAAMVGLNGAAVGLITAIS